MASSLKIEHDDNFIRGCYKIPTVDGDLIICAQIPLYPLRRMLMQEFLARKGSGTDVAVGFEWNRIISSGEETARKMAVKKAAKMINNIVNTPAGQSVIEWADFKVPGLGISVDAARAGFNLLLQARAGDEESRDKLEELGEAAMDGNQMAMVACDALRKMHSIMEQNGIQGEAEISGWLWNVPQYSTIGGRRRMGGGGSIFGKIFRLGR